MIYSVEGRIVKVDDRFFENKVKSLTYQYQGNFFPQSYYASNPNVGSGYSDGNEIIFFKSTKPNTLTVNYGDGNSVTKEFTPSGSTFICGLTINTENHPYAIPQHVYDDGFTGLRNITFEFLDPDYIIEIKFRFVQLFGSLPVDTIYFKNLSDLSYHYTSNIVLVPDSFPKKVKTFTLSNALQNRLESLPDTLFSTEIQDLNLSSSYDLSDNISSNFFKINILKDTLTNLSLQSCSIALLPQSLSECVLVSDLRLLSNPIKNPEVLETLFNLDRLYIGCGSFENGLFETNNLTRLRNFWVPNMTESLILEIPLKWTGLKALTSFVRFQNVVKTNFLFQLFIENFYTLCTQNGFLDPSSTEAQNTGFPEQFRDISWGAGNDWFTVTNSIQAPSGFSLGISNGTPANNAEKIYVLVENYGHTVELAP
jgi:hypothetical protein